MRIKFRVFSMLIAMAMFLNCLSGVTIDGATVNGMDVALVAKTTMTANNVYYGGLYEPTAGIYFGASYEEDNHVASKDNSNYYEDYVNNRYPKKNSAYLIHLDFGTSIESIETSLEFADEANVAIVLVWEVSETYSSMSGFDAYIDETAQYLRWLDVPVFISYGARMNNTAGIANSTEFVNNFQHVSWRVREVASDIAIVWTVDDDSPEDLEGFYPGDAYVDWIGISSFIKPGEDSLKSIGTIIEKYGHDKPVMLTEVGTARFARSGARYMIDWAEQELRKLYSYVPMMYPQIKGIFLHNGPVASDKFHFYDIHSSEELVDAYNDLVDNDIFLEDIQASGSERYAVVDSQKDPSVFVEENSVEISTFINLDDFEDVEVVYRIDGKKMSRVKAVPFTYKLQTIGLSDEKHDLLIQVYEDDVLLVDQAYTLVRNEEGTLIEKGDYQVIAFDDIRSHWAETYIIDVSKRGIVVGSDGSFRPDDVITRAEVASLITKLGRLDEYGAVSYRDVTSSQWYFRYVGNADDYLTGYGNYYYPMAYASREEIITALVKMKGINLSDITTKDREDFIEDYSDHWTINEAYKDYMILAAKYDIIGGYDDGTLRPQAYMKRGEVAKVLYTSFYQ